MKRKRVIAAVLTVIALLAAAGGVWWYYEENVKITLPVNEKTAIRIGKAAIEEKFPEYTSGKVLEIYNIQYHAVDEGHTWKVIWYPQSKMQPNTISFGDVLLAIVDKTSGEVLDVRKLEEG